MPRTNAIVSARIAASLLLLAISSFTAVAQQANPLEDAPRPNPGYVRIYEENDVFYLLRTHPARTDRWYTQGVRFEWTHDSDRDRTFFFGIPSDFWCSWLCGRGYQSGFTNSGWAIGQNIYTPQDISIGTPQPEDRPWAGYLYGGRIAEQSYIFSNWDVERQDRFEIDVGIVGPPALGREAQNGWHTILGIGLGQGWDNQLKTEPTALLRYDAVVRWPKCAQSFDVQPYGRVYLGTVLTAADAGITVRVGHRLSGLVPGTIAPSATAPALARVPGGCPPTGTETGPLNSWSLFARVQARAVANDLFLDGGFVRNGPSVHKHDMVYETAWGADVAVSTHWAVALQFVTRTAEFEAPPGSHGVQRFGSIQVHCTECMSWLTK